MGQLFAQLFAKLPTVAAMAAALMFVVVVGVAPCMTRGPSLGLTAQHHLSFWQPLLYTHFTADEPWISSLQFE
jgi:hypothetical protein